MRKIYTVVFALMVLISVTMSAMAAPAPADDVASLEISEPTPAPTGDVSPLADEVQHEMAMNSIRNMK